MQSRCAKGHLVLVQRMVIGKYFEASLESFHDFTIKKYRWEIIGKSLCCSLYFRKKVYLMIVED